MGETFREHAKIQGPILRTPTFQVCIRDTEHGGLSRAIYFSLWTRVPSTMFSPTPMTTKSPPRSGTTFPHCLEKVSYFLAPFSFAHVNRESQVSFASKVLSIASRLAFIFFSISVDAHEFPVQTETHHGDYNPSRCTSFV